MPDTGGELSGRLVRRFFLGFINLHVLYHAQKGPVYGKEIRIELQRHGYELSFGTLYPVLHALEKDGYLKSEEKNTDGKIRKYYTITESGRAVYRYSVDRAKELFAEILG